MAVLALAGPSVPIAAADEGPPIPVAVDAASAALDAALESASAVSTAGAAPQDSVTAVVEELTQPLAVIDEAAPPAPAPATAEAAPAETAAPPTPEPDDPVVAEPAATEPEAGTTAAGAATTVEPRATEPAPVETAPASTATEQQAAPEAPAAPAVQVQPINLNVAVRIDSPGDNGAVTQVNAAVAAAAEQYQPDASQYHSPGPESTAPAAPAPAPEPGPAETTAPTEETGWTWTLTCGGFTHQLAPAGMLPENWTWNWNWNCGSQQGESPNIDSQNSGQYHTGVMQYQPVNLNVSIRIGSPGNDGSVVQTNVAVAVVVPPVTLPVVTLPVGTTASAPIPVVTTGSPSESSEPQSVALFEVGITAAVVADIAAEYDTALAAWISAGPARPFLGGSSPAPFGATPTLARALPLAAAVRSAAYGQLRTAPAVAPARSAAATHVVAARPHATARDAQAAGGGSKTNERKRSLPPRRAPLLASGLAAAAPAAGADGGWPFVALLLVPFAFALVDRAGRAAREAGLPADAELSSRRERPG